MSRAKDGERPRSGSLRQWPRPEIWRTVKDATEAIASFEQREQAILVQRGGESCQAVYPEWHEDRKTCVLVMMATFRQEFFDVWRLSQWALSEEFFGASA